MYVHVVMNICTLNGIDVGKQIPQVIFFSAGSDIASLRITLLQTPPIDYTVLHSI